jgi:hypothetical protein
MAGWIKIYREITKHWIFQDAEKFKWWIDMIFLASYEDNRTVIGNKIVEVKRGQFLGSLSFFIKRWGVSKERVINFLRLLQSDGMINKESDKNVTLITICNYESYQDVPDNKADNLSDYKVNNPLDNLPDTTKEGKEIQEIYNTNSARTHEERISWETSRERGFYETFKARGAYIPMGTATGKSGKEILALLDVYMANREVRDMGHKDYNEFVNLFKWHIENGKVKVHDQPQQKKSKNILEMYG